MQKQKLIELAQELSAFYEHFSSSDFYRGLQRLLKMYFLCLTTILCLNEGYVQPKGKACFVYILVNILSITVGRIGSLQTILSKMKLPNTGRFLVIFKKETLIESEGGE